MLQRKAVEPGTLDLLKALMKLEVLSDFALGGGTALALQFGHRISIDLDLFSSKEFDSELVLNHLKTDLGRDVTVLGKAKNTLNLTISGVKVDCLSHRYPLTGQNEMIEGVRLLSISDIAAMKLSAVAQRGSKKDFYDLAELLKHYSLKVLTELYFSKYGQENSFYLIKALGYFEDAENEPSPNPLNSMTWKEVKASIISSIQDFK